jgi:hypothetical protein
MKNIRPIFVALTTILILITIQSTSAHAQFGGYAGSSLQLGFDAQSVALGNAVSAGFSKHNPMDSTYLEVQPYYNPALAASNTSNTHFSLSVFQLGLDRHYQSLGARLALPPKAGLFIGLIRAGVHDIDTRSLSGYPLGMVSTSDVQLQSAFGIRLSEWVHAGIGFKINRTDYHAEMKASTSVGVDIGMLFKLSQHTHWAFVVQDLLAEHTWNSGDLYNQPQSRNRVEAMPLRLKTSVSTYVMDTNLFAEYEIKRFSSEVTTRELFLADGASVQYVETLETRFTSASFLRIAASRSLHPFFRLHMGWNRYLGGLSSNEWRSGFSLSMPFQPALKVDYGFSTSSDHLKSTHIFTLRYIL